MSKHRYSVYFYGTGETGACKSEELDPYDDRNRGRFNSDKQMKKEDYKEAVRQIEAAISGNDPAPIISNEQLMKSSNNSQSDFEISQDYDTNDESQLHIDEEENAQSTPQPLKKKSVLTKVKLLPLVMPTSTPEAEPREKENEEKVSRSGRKIKEKKMSLDEMDIDEVFSQPPRKKNKPDEARAVKQTTPAHAENAAFEEFRRNKLHILKDPVKKEAMQTQYDMITLIQEIKMSLGLEKVNIVYSLDMIEKLKASVVPNITKIMLLKYPNIVECIKRLRKYIGNTTSWELDESELDEFKNKAEQIRKTADDIYNSFKVSSESIS